MSVRPNLCRDQKIRFIVSFYLFENFQRNNMRKNLKSINVDVRVTRAASLCVAPRGFHNKVSIVPESTSPEVSVRQKFEIQIQIPNRFFCNRFYDNLCSSECR